MNNSIAEPLLPKTFPNRTTLISEWYNGYLINLKKFFTPLSKLINNDLENKKKYFLKSKKARMFINEKLVNKNCYKMFLVELKNI